MSARWTEMEPCGPQVAGDVGGDLQDPDTEAYSRRWYRPLPRGGGFMVITVIMYAMRDAGRKWIATNLEFGRAVVEPQSGDDVEYLNHSEDDSAQDGPDTEPWPTNEDLKEELGRYPVTIHDAWEGN